MVGERQEDTDIYIKYIVVLVKETDLNLFSTQMLENILTGNGKLVNGKKRNWNFRVLHDNICAGRTEKK